ncbi:hypothetical protein [Streptomyces sp. WAC08241]|uniref:hypothetical protein n=1 Tax=Streptomyces sp. WAC08241 TaxID=2487421 RepID=UPI000F76C07C|nr:hypothetical protein [Streptomyces sp. WAC08241]RSS35233.1 hypothetical protein EF906_27945 [Streptomyces sp. WAC08241]
MAISIAQPRASQIPRGLVKYQEARRLFAETGHKPPPETTMRRWVQDFGLRTTKINGRVYVSYSDLLVPHAAWVNHTYSELLATRAAGATGTIP